VLAEDEGGPDRWAGRSVIRDRNSDQSTMVGQFDFNGRASMDERIRDQLAGQKYRGIDEVRRAMVEERTDEVSSSTGTSHLSWKMFRGRHLTSSRPFVDRHIRGRTTMYPVGQRQKPIGPEPIGIGLKMGLRSSAFSQGRSR
jgi:hypothetical protein